MSKNQHADATMKKKYTHTSKAEWDTFTGDFRDICKLHKDKLHTVVFDNDLHAAVTRRITAESKKEAADEGLTSPQAIAAHAQARLDEHLEECLSTAFSMLVMNIEHPRLKDTLRKKHDDDAHDAYKYIEAHWAVAGNQTRITIEAEKRKDHIEAGIRNPNYAGVKEFADVLVERNDELKGSPHYHDDPMLVTVLLDAIACHHGSLIRHFRTAHRPHLNDYDQTLKLILEEVEENDRVEAKAAERTQREAFAAKVEQIAAREAKVEQLEASLKARLAQVERGANQARREKPTCEHCGGPHSGTCFGKEIAEGRMTKAEAMAALPSRYDEAARTRMVDSAVRRYQERHAKGAPSEQPRSAVAPGQPPPRKPLAACTKVVSVLRADTRQRADEQSGDGPMALKQDSRAAHDQRREVLPLRRACLTAREGARC